MREGVTSFVFVTKIVRYMQLSRLKAAWRWFNMRWYGKWLRKGARYLVLVAVVCYLGYQFTEIGWKNVWNALPQTPWFYIISLGMYMILPMAESLLYSHAWGETAQKMMPIFFRKRVFNHDVMGYSGEVYFYWWARKNLPLPGKRLLATIKDNTLVSGAVSTGLAVSVLAIFFLFGQITLLEPYMPTSTNTWLASGVLVLIVGGVGVAFRRFIFSLPAKMLAVFAGVHVVRFLLTNGLQVLQWTVVMPEVSMASWFTLVSLMIVINQLPFLPSRDLVFVGAGIELSGWLGISPAAVAGMLLVKSVIDKSLNLLVFLATSLQSRQLDNIPSRMEVQKDVEEAPADNSQQKIADRPQPIGDLHE